MFGIFRNLYNPDCYVIMSAPKPGTSECTPVAVYSSQVQASAALQQGQTIKCVPYHTFQPLRTPSPAGQPPLIPRPPRIEPIRLPDPNNPPFWINRRS